MSDASAATPIRTRQTKIVATLGPASSTYEMIRKLFVAGVDAFRLNFSHGAHADHGERVKIIRDLERETGRPICIIADLQGPKLRIGRFAAHKVHLQAGQKFRLDLDHTPGDNTRVELPHPEILAVLMPGHDVLLDDGKVRIRVVSRGEDWLETEVIAGTFLSDHKGFNIPGVLVPLPPLTPKDRVDLEYALTQGVDWVALSFVQLPSDLEEPRRIIGSQANLMVKVEKPSAVAHLEEIVAAADGLMVARGDLGVEMPLEEVPGIQKRMIRLARDKGKPIIVATQMLESMISAPSPTRAEASDVATAVFDGTDAVMLSAETASGQYPVEAVEFMDRALRKVERDPIYRSILHSTTIKNMRPDFVMTAAAVTVAEQINACALVTFTALGATALRAARERPSVPILCLTPTTKRGRQLVLSYGVSVFPTELGTFEDFAPKACDIVKRAGVGSTGSQLVITAGFPLGVPGSTNVLRVVSVE